MTIGIFFKKLAQWNNGVVHATLDPQGQGVVRLHLVPPRPTLFGHPPSLLRINGWVTLPIGESWSTLLRTFLLTLSEMSSPGVEISDDQQDAILAETVARVQNFYPDVPPERLMADLDEIVGMCIAIAHGEEVPEEVLRSEMTLKQYSRFMRGPQRMDLIVSPMRINGAWMCPLSCGACYADQPGMDVTTVLSTRQWQRIIDKCRQIGVSDLTFTGGEPTEREDLAKLIEYASWFVTRVNTNGVNLTPVLCESLAAANLDSVQVTLYSHDARTHDFCVGRKGAWQSTVQGIQNAIATGLNVSINVPLVRKNCDFGGTLRFINDLGVRFVSCSGLIGTGRATTLIDRDKALTREELYQIMVEGTTIAQELGIELTFTSPGELTREQLESLNLSVPVCGAALSNMAVMPNGQAVACQSWLKSTRGLGNMLYIPWVLIWNHPVALWLRFFKATKEDCVLEA